jgi:tagatose-1,6-bisphosphate aldolase non-catalytic subunit AgaZ/GatZ
MALTGSMTIKNIPVANAFLQLAHFQVIPGLELNGVVKIYTNAEQAQNSENAIDQIIVVTVDDLVTDYKTQLYNELVQDSRFANLTPTPDINNIITTGMQRMYFRQPIGFYDPETDTATRFI